MFLVGNIVRRRRFGFKEFWVCLWENFLELKFSGKVYFFSVGRELVGVLEGVAGVVVVR